MESEIGISKFKNIDGVTCYMNSILAILQQIPILCDYLISNNYRSLLKDDNYNEKIIYQLHKLFRISMSMNNANLTPYTLRKVCADKDFTWGERQQQDSSEFLQFIITKVEEEIGSKVKFIPGLTNKEISFTNSLKIIQSQIEYQTFVKNEFSPFKTFFTGLENTQLTCKTCLTDKSKYETFSIWQLPIPVSKDNMKKEFDIKECMEKWIEKEVLDDKLTCDFCGLKSKVSKKCSIFNPPKVLVIQLKRFERNNYGNLTNKLNNKVNFPINNLDISDYVSNPILKKENCLYNLMAVNLHYGVANSGHYYSVVKNRSDNLWYVFNDDDTPVKVNKISEIVDYKAYLLFYYKVT
tara:strand:+ start:6797 stop:7852 length:1056 start_codon:yes stop_codon:yes gene_type:complete